MSKFIYGPGDMLTMSGFFQLCGTFSENTFLNIDAPHGLWPVKTIIAGSEDREDFEASSTHCQGT